MSTALPDFASRWRGAAARQSRAGTSSIARWPGAQSQGPIRSTLGEGDTAERLLMTHAIEDNNGRFLGAMLVARNLGYISQVHSTLNYSRKLAALGRLMAGVAHEVKNPLNAMTIHLELLKQQAGDVSPPGLGRSEPAATAPPSPRDVTKHVDIIGSEIRRLDEVLNGFLKFARPDELKLQPVPLAASSATSSPR